MPTEGEKFVNTRRNETMTQYLNQQYVVCHFCAALKVAVGTVANPDGELD